MARVTPLDIVKELKSRFDDDSVNAAFQLIEAPTPTPFTSWLISCLLGGRGGNLLWPRIEKHLRANPTEPNLMSLADRLPAQEIHELCLQAKIDVNSFSTRVKEGHFPPVRILPVESQQKLFDNLRQEIWGETNAKSVSHILGFLLEVDTEPYTDWVVREESLTLAAKWCLECPDKKHVKAGLASVLRKTSNFKLVRHAEKLLDSCEWVHDDIFLLVSLMQATRSARHNRLIRNYLKNSAPLHHAYVVSVWIISTQCCSEALLWGKKMIRSRHRGSKQVVASLCQFSHRKSVSRWLVRFFRAQRNNNESAGCFPAHVLTEHPTKRNVLFASQQFEYGDSECRDGMLAGLVKHSREKYFIDLAKENVLAFPNAENSFKLMCRIAPREPEVAVPWLAEWIKTAPTEQVLIGLTAIIGAAPSSEYLEEARSLLSRLKGISMLSLTFGEADLLRAVLAVNPTPDLIEQASLFLQSNPPKRRMLTRILGRIRHLVVAAGNEKGD